MEHEAGVIGFIALGIPVVVALLWLGIPYVTKMFRKRK